MIIFLVMSQNMCFGCSKESPTTYILVEKYEKGEFQICPRMDFHNILYVEYLCYNNYKNEITLFLEGC